MARNLSYLLICHDLSVVGPLPDEVAVMDRGQLGERGAVSDIFTRPVHPATIALRAGVPAML